MRNHSLWAWLLIVSNLSQPASAQNPGSCSEETLATLTPQLMRDLPNYANRAIQRSRRLSRSVDIFSYVLVAGKPEFKPLPLKPGEDPAVESKGVNQIFFTTLERQYLNQRATLLQEFHRLLLTKTPDGWSLVMMFTQTGAYPQNQVVSPPRDSTNSAIAQGIKDWLRDCDAGSIKVNYSKK